MRLGIAYDGTNFNGWSRQPELRTVQGEIERTLETVFNRVRPLPVLTVAGRTDAGVHATGQVAHVDLDVAALNALVRKPPKGKPAHDPGQALVRRINGLLGPEEDARITSAVPAEDGFDARFSAIWRRYEYRIADRDAFRDPLQRARTVWLHQALDIEAMDAAAQQLVGLHDFASYCKPRERATTIRTLESFRWRQDSDGVLIASLQADAFCHSMVRALVGASVAVGVGNHEPEALVELRDARERTNAFVIMPARGLTLTEVGYPEPGQMGVRANETRRRRSVPAAEPFAEPLATPLTLSS